MNQKQERLFKELPVWRDIFTMAVPAVINILVMVLYNMADMFFVARLHDDVQVASISIVAPAFTMMMALGSMVGGGGCALIAQTMGEPLLQPVLLGERHVRRDLRRSGPVWKECHPRLPGGQ